MEIEEDKKEDKVENDPEEVELEKDETEMAGKKVDEFVEGKPEEEVKEKEDETSMSAETMDSDSSDDAPEEVCFLFRKSKIFRYNSYIITRIKGILGEDKFNRYFASLYEGKEKGILTV